MTNLELLTGQIETFTKLLDFMSNNYRTRNMHINVFSYKNEYESVELSADSEIVGRLNYKIPQQKRLIFSRLFTNKHERLYERLITKLGELLVRCEDDGMTVTYCNIAADLDLSVVSMILPEETSASGSSCGSSCDYDHSY